MTTVQTRAVTEDEAELRLDRWFRRHFPNVTQGAIQRLCRTGQVRVDGKRVDTGTRLEPGQAIRVPPLPDAPPPKPTEPHQFNPAIARELEAMVLHRDDWVLVLNKPHGLAVQGGPGITRHLDGLLDGLRMGSEHRPRLVHRLDRDTSGCLVLARTPGTAGQAGGGVPRAGRQQDLLGRCRWPARAGGGPDRPAAAALHWPARGAQRAGGAGRQRGRAGRHRLRHAGPRRAEAGLDGAVPRHGPHAPVARALRGAGRPYRGGHQVSRTRPQRLRQPP